jgi:hypothetical protein
MSAQGKDTRHAHCQRKAEGIERATGWTEEVDLIVADDSDDEMA